jgi:hypothetical protein
MKRRIKTIAILLKSYFSHMSRIIEEILASREGEYDYKNKYNAYTVKSR